MEHRVRGFNLRAVHLPPAQSLASTWSRHRGLAAAGLKTVTRTSTKLRRNHSLFTRGCADPNYSDSSEQQYFIFKGKVLYCSYTRR